MPDDRQVISRAEVVTPELLAELADRYPTNPFLTPGYARFRSTSGQTTTALTQRSPSGELLSGCLLHQVPVGKLHRSVEIPSLTRPADAGGFWDALHAFCASLRITHLTIATYGSDPVEIPVTAAESGRTIRREWVMELPASLTPELWSSNHRRNVRKGNKNRLKLTVCNAEGASLHETLIRNSLTRRAETGQQVPTGVTSREIECMAEAGAGLLYQARSDDGQVVSSLFVLRSSLGAYYHSAGTSQTGMQLGASHWLVARTAESLCAAGCRTFNLGGSKPELAGLTRFKTDFRTRSVDLQSTSWVMGTTWLGKSLAGGKRIFRNPSLLLDSRSYRSENYDLFRMPTDSVAPKLPNGVTFQRIDFKTALDLYWNYPEIKLHSSQFTDFENAAVATLSVDGEFAHITWLESANSATTRLFGGSRLAPSDRLVSRYFTLPNHRGHGLFLLALQHLGKTMLKDAGVLNFWVPCRRDDVAAAKILRSLGCLPSGRLRLVFTPVRPRPFRLFR